MAWGDWLAQLMKKRVTLDLEVVGWSPMFRVQITLKILRELEINPFPTMLPHAKVCQGNRNYIFFPK